MQFDFSSFHKGHELAVVGHGGSVLVVCLDCHVAADIEAISAKISPADSYKIDPAERALLGKLSAGVPFAGKVASL